MRKSRLDALRCPDDGTKLRVNTEEKVIGDDLVEGELICVEGHVWIVSDGIPSLVNMLEVQGSSPKESSSMFHEIPAVTLRIHRD